MISVEEIREALGGDEADRLTDTEVERWRGFLYLIAELAVESEECRQQEEAA